MSTSVEVRHLCGKARRLSLNSLQTPALLFQTSGGFQPYLSNDMLEKLPETPAFYMPIGDLYPILEVMKRSGKDLHQVTALKNNFLHVQFRNIENFTSYKNGNKGLGFMTKDGNRTITVEEFYNYVNVLKPNSFTCLPDEVNLSVGVRKGNQSLVNTEKWIDKGLEMNTTNAINVNKDEKRFLNHIDSVLSKKIQGVSINGLFLGEGVEERERFLDVILEKIPTETVRLLSGPQTPLEILNAINRGIDLIPCSLPLYMAENGQASTFWNGFEYERTQEQDANVLQLTDIRYEHDHQPILKGCPCYTCTHFTRGYINHLFDVHELLGFMLLLQHNMHHYLHFIQNVRKHIEEDTLSQFTQTFVEKYTHHSH